MKIDWWLAVVAAPFVVTCAIVGSAVVMGVTTPSPVHPDLSPACVKANRAWIAGRMHGPAPCPPSPPPTPTPEPTKKGETVKYTLHVLTAHSLRVRSEDDHPLDKSALRRNSTA